MVSRRGVLALPLALLGCGGERETAPAVPAPDRASVFERLVSARPADVDGVVADALRGGASADAVFGASLDTVLRTRNDGVDIHSMAAIVGAREVRRDANDALERVSPLFFVARSNHAWSQRRVVAQRPASAASLELAVDTSDWRSADAAMAGRLAADGADAAMRTMRSLGVQPRGDLHAVIWTAHVEALRELAGPHEALLLRNLARMIANSPTTSAPLEPLAFDARDGTDAEEILRAWRAAPDADLSGLSPRAILDALALRCVELRFGEPFTTGTALHYNTACEAYGSLARDDAAVTNALARLRPHAPRPDGPDVLTLDEGPGDPFELSRRDVVAAYRAALRRVGQDERAFVADVRARVARHGGGEHDYKVFAALRSTAARMARPRDRARVLASMAMMNVARAREPAPHVRAARQVADTLG